LNQAFKARVLRAYRALFPEGQSAFVVAASVFVGVFIAVLPTFGVALPLTVLATAFLRVPKGPGLIASFIATPPTLLFFFYPLAYLLGEKLTSTPAPALVNRAEVRDLAPLSLSEVFAMGDQAGTHVIAFLVGTLLVALVTAAVVAAVCYVIITRRRASAR
jgi:uncharacterized protein (DUF2062 family)